jgi:hypothetical protein
MHLPAAAAGPTSQPAASLPASQAGLWYLRFLEKHQNLTCWTS